MNAFRTPENVARKRIVMSHVPNAKYASGPPTANCCPEACFSASLSDMVESTRRHARE